jgi:predicted transcriptional regulator
MTAIMITTNKQKERTDGKQNKIKMSLAAEVSLYFRSIKHNNGGSRWIRREEKRNGKGRIDILHKKISIGVCLHATKGTRGGV